MQVTMNYGDMTLSQTLSDDPSFGAEYGSYNDLNDIAAIMDNGGGDWLYGWNNNDPNYAKMVYLLNRLSLTEYQFDWLSQNVEISNELYNYLLAKADADATQMSQIHAIELVRQDDYSYVYYIQNYLGTIDLNQTTPWWANNPYLQPHGGVSFGTWAINYLGQNPSVTMPIFQNQFMTNSEGPDGASDAAFWDDPNLTFIHQNVPSWANFRDAFPKRSDPLYNTAQKLYASIGGAVYANGYTGPESNTCAARVSKSLNYSGITIPNIPDKTFLGSDGKYYFLGAENLNRWMRKTFGCGNPNTAIGEYLNPDCLHFAPSDIGMNGQNLPSLLYGIHGIYSMVSTNPSWATGHADPLYSPNATCDGECDFDGPVKYIDVWILQ